ncbi:hypothetical protein EIP91_006909 [Steccherinum ochraceum]|uniref:RNA polymerase II-associated protein 3 n=1 Tax=Steccherinum ochraceum TaxID=92696 RepID=A0A4V2MVG9_9APHY|nr:hypothetical protein EIP91_006909 [Steccherinum ochraceum]
MLRPRSHDLFCKGNDAFGAGDFPAAIGHYTSAVLADPSNPIYPLNRAAAYLKLGKHQDAERDCSTVIRLDPKNPKAWYRRAQARQGLDVWDDALADYRQVLSLEPNNAGVKVDIERMLFMIKNGKKPTRRKPEEVLASPVPSEPPVDKPRRRRVPIAIVDHDPAPSTSSPKPDVPTSVDLLAPVSTRKLTTPVPAAPTPPKPQARAAPSLPATRSGGGIFRRDGNHQVFGAKDEQKADTGSGDAPPLNVDILPKEFAELSVKATQSVPTSMYAFDRNWMALKTPQARWTYLQQISPESLPSVFKTSLDASLLASIIQTFHGLLATDIDRSTLKGYVAHLPKVSRWPTLILFLSPEEQKMVKEIWGALPAGADDTQLRKAWGLR